MKYLKIALMVGVISLLGLTSCSNKQDTPAALSVEIQYQDNTIPITGIEETVEAVYDSVVAIDSYTDSSLVGSGSGVLFAYDEANNLSFIVTCHHVIEDCNSFVVTLSDQTELDATLVGGDPATDLAVLSVQETDLTYAALAKDTSNLRLGQQVICIGNPLGILPGSVSSGIISYLNRSVVTEDYRTMTLIQTDVAINSGNSGGGLFQLDGSLIGIVNAKFASSGVEGLGFAIPMDTTLKIIEELLQSAQYHPETQQWETGSIEGRWNLEGTFQAYNSFKNETVLLVTELASNPTASDYNCFALYDQIAAVSIRSDSHYQAISSPEEFYTILYQSDLKIGDTIYLEVYNIYGNLRTVFFDLIQYRYTV